MTFKRYWWVFILMLSCGSWADDTDLYLLAPTNHGRAKVLVIFDNSASMDTLETEIKGSYDPSVTYEPVGSSHSYQGRMIYFTVGTGMDETSLPVPDSPSESRRFNEILNGCAAALDALNTYGRFTGYIREYISSGNNRGTWQTLKQNSGADSNNPIECYEDMAASNASNNNSITGYSNGYPQNGVTSGSGSKKVYVPWGNPPAQDLASTFIKGELVTLYTDNYLRWYYGEDTGMVSTSRLDIAKEAMTGVISSMSAVDFGLAVFNLDYPSEGNRDGGRIIAGIKARTAAEKQTLISTIENLPAETNTPLCETLFEAYRYFSGGPITFGHSDSNYSGNNMNYKGNKPPYDTSVEASGRYISPMSVCSDVAYVIYVTDGEPTLDASADSAIQSLVAGRTLATTQDGKTDNGNYSQYTYDSKNAKKSFLPALASYMYWHDQVPSSTTFQHVATFTIGFALDTDSVAEPLLIETARRGGGQYYAANNVASLQAAFSNALDQITDEGQHFAAPGVAYSNADPTRTLDAAYYALFEPAHGPRWAGNLKKFKVNSAGTLVDANGNAAIASSGGIKETACSFWSNCSSSADGYYVQEGGAARSIVPANRTFYSDVAANGGLALLSRSTASSRAGGDSALFSYMGMISDGSAVATQLDLAFSWIRGNNVDQDSDGNFSSDDYSGVRGDIMGDPMHSQPLAIDYNSNGSSDVRIFVGTNHGVLHSFKDSGSSVVERWAFMPYELLPNVQTLRDNNYASGHSIYGIDGSPVAYLERNSSGVLTKAWLFIGMRRGGSSYYAFDVTQPDAPVLLWHINSSTTGFSELGQTWSTPVVTKVPGYDKPVLIFGGGYNPGYDTGSGTNGDGRNVYIVDAETGTLRYNFGSNGNTALTGIEDSIAGAIATLDSDGDGITDRLYAADLGGNVWRMDMPATTTSSWSGFKFAALGGDTTATDRRFFYEPVVAQTEFTNTTTVSVTDVDGNTTTTTAYQNVPYDAVTLGSGNRVAPLGTTTTDMFFVLQDRNVISKTFGGTGATVPTALTLSSLYNVTDAAPTTDEENLTYGTKLGWYYDFKDVGEKSLSPATIIKGKVYFTSFTPALDNPEETCQVSSTGRLYTFDLHKGGRYNEEYIDVCQDCIPQAPKIITPAVDPDHPENPDAVLIIGSGECTSGGECSGTVALDSGLTTNKIYYHINE